MNTKATASVVKVTGNLVTATIESGDVLKNEVAYVLVNNETRLKSETIRILGNRVDMQVFEDTKGIKVGAKVEFTGEMLSIELGPGILNSVFDGLQNPLDRIAEKHGFFLPRGVYIDALKSDDEWTFTPTVKKGDKVVAGDFLGGVPEGNIIHKIMVPFDFTGTGEVVSVEKGNFTIKDTVAEIRDEKGKIHSITMLIKWPVKKPITQYMQKANHIERLFPEEPFTTGVRIVDTFFPIARGGTACIPGPFGSGKTVLQHLISKYSSADIVIIVACGERAGEVVETIKEFPEIIDPRTNKPLMERTVIICNTSSMPVAAREASVYTGITIGEYYRQMGLDTLIIADSTSRWAQALREMSGRLEEIPGEEAFPAYLDSAIKNLYERAGYYKLKDGSFGSLTMIGTVSPAGGNFEEPVTQSTLSTVKTFLGLSYNRAYKRFFPAIEPLISWSRYLKQMEKFYNAEMGENWISLVEDNIKLLKDGEGINQMMQVSGEEGVTLDDFLKFQKSLFLDMVYLQQDAFDSIDAFTEIERQKITFLYINDILNKEFNFNDKKDIREFFVKLTEIFKNMNYAKFDTSKYKEYRNELDSLVNSKL